MVKNRTAKILLFYVKLKDVRAGENQYETINEIMSVQSEIIQRQN